MKSQRRILAYALGASAFASLIGPVHAASNSTTSCANSSLPPEILDGPPISENPKPLHVTHMRAASGTLTLAIAGNGTDRNAGLACVKALKPRSGEVLVFSSMELQDFWDHDTALPLDYLWLDEKGKVTKISTDSRATGRAVEGSGFAHRSGIGRYVVILPAGTAFSTGIKIGSTLYDRDLYSGDVPAGTSDEAEAIPKLPIPAPTDTATPPTPTPAPTMTPFLMNPVLGGSSTPTQIRALDMTTPMPITEITTVPSAKPVTEPSTLANTATAVPKPLPTAIPTLPPATPDPLLTSVPTVAPIIVPTPTPTPAIVPHPEAVPSPSAASTPVEPTAQDIDNMSTLTPRVIVTMKPTVTPATAFPSAYPAPYATTTATPFPNTQDTPQATHYPVSTPPADPTPYPYTDNSNDQLDMMYENTSATSRVNTEHPSSSIAPKPYFTHLPKPSRTTEPAKSHTASGFKQTTVSQPTTTPTSRPTPVATGSPKPQPRKTAVPTGRELFPVRNTFKVQVDP